MRVALIAPPYPLEEAPSPPLGLSYAASAFEQAGAEVKIIDFIISRYTPEKLTRELENFKPDLLGANSVTMNFPQAAEIVTTAKKIDPSLLTLMGGPHVSFDVIKTLKTYPEIDMLVIGEGEETISEIVDHFQGQGNWGDIQGVAFRENGTIIQTGKRALIDDLNRLPLPARHLLPMSRYQALGFPVSMITGRGCPYSCIFCQGRKMVGSKARSRKASLVVDEIEQILSYGFTRINIADDLFTSDREKVWEVCEEIRRRKLTLTWTAFSRVNTVDKETLRLMRETGCDCVSFGIESGNQEVLKRVKKGITLDQARKAVALCKEVGILPHASFMVGLPGETPETLKDTAEFSKGLDIIYGFHFLAPFPGTTVREKIDQYDLEILTDDWSRYDANSAIVRTSALTPEAINQFVAEFDEEINQAWEKQVRGFHDKTNTPEQDLRVAGHYRMRLVYKMLSEDLLETWGTFPADTQDGDPGENMDPLCQRLEEATGFGSDLVHQTLKSFIDAGYIKFRIEANSLIWYWTHNNKVD
ncbi:MAG: radical SAM protein [Deltaproteobacteria bacterium]|nr:radical SAM protein [Deltaproteobacteria bacterium]